MTCTCSRTLVPISGKRTRNTPATCCVSIDVLEDAHPCLLLPVVCDWLADALAMAILMSPGLAALRDGGEKCSRLLCLLATGPASRAAAEYACRVRLYLDPVVVGANCMTVISKLHPNTMVTCSSGTFKTNISPTGNERSYGSTAVQVAAPWMGL